eukprot:m.15617 g.15617  ORF g.15617 m.15617 type:complete len:230 (-) comp4499_c0_seq1:154-843(-)
MGDDKAVDGSLLGDVSQWSDDGVVGIVKSVFVPGVNTAIVRFLALIFVALLINDIVLIMFFGWNIHFVVLFFLTIGLGGAMFWYVGELLKVEAEEKEKKEKEELEEKAKKNVGDKKSETTNGKKEMIVADVADVAEDEKKSEKEVKDGSVNSTSKIAAVAKETPKVEVVEEDTVEKKDVVQAVEEEVEELKPLDEEVESSEHSESESESEDEGATPSAGLRKRRNRATQ